MMIHDIFLIFSSSDMPSKGFSLWKQVYKPSYGLLTIFLLYLIQVTLSENVS